MSTPRFLAALVLAWSLLVAGVLVLARAPGSDAGQSPVSQDAFVYAALLDSLALDGTQVVVTVADDDDQNSATVFDLPSHIPAHRQVLVVPRATLVPQRDQDRSARDYWKEFERRFPEAYGWFDLSPVEYQDAGRAAVVTYGHHCGWLCGSGGPVELRRTERGWQVVKVTVVWVS